jgi:hypothetical protein
MSNYSDLQRAESIKAAGAYADEVEQLFTYFDELNLKHFSSLLEYPFVQIKTYDEINQAGEFMGFCMPPSGNYLTGAIGVDARIINFSSLPDKLTHAQNVLVHETVHLEFLMQNWGRQITQSNFHSFDYACRCNRIGHFYGWKPVRSSRKFSQKKKRHVLNCTSWPHFSQNDPAAEADYFQVSRLLKVSRLEARARLANPSAERDALAVKASFLRLMEKASTLEVKAECHELHRLLSMHGKIDFDL